MIETTTQAQDVRAPQGAITITLRQTQKLLEFFGGHDTEVTIGLALEGMPPGLYSWCTEYPEEGCQYLGPTEVDDELASNGTDWAVDLGQLQQGDIELLQDAVEALRHSTSKLQRDHALHGLQRRIEAARSLTAPADGTPVASNANDLPPVHIDVERMNRALRGPRIMIPQGLSAEEVVAFITAHADALDLADGKTPAAPPTWREQVGATITDLTDEEKADCGLLSEIDPDGAGGNNGR